MYVGTYTDKQQSKGIYAYRFQDQERTDWISVGLAVNHQPASFLVVDRNQKFVYAVNETLTYEGKRAGSVSAFAIDPATGHFEAAQ